MWTEVSTRSATSWRIRDRVSLPGAFISRAASPPCSPTAFSASTCAPPCWCTTSRAHPWRWLKSTATDAAAEALRRQVLQTELAAEHHQQRWMEHALPIAPGPRDQKLAAANLAHYVDTLERQPDAALQAALSTLCRLSTQTLERLAPGAAD